MNTHFEHYIDVQTGQVKSAQGKTCLYTSAIGSCIAIGAVSIRRQFAIMAHVMLPGYGLNHKDRSCRFAGHAIEKMIHIAQINRCDLREMQIALAGGGNVIQDPKDTICQANIQSIVQLLSDHDIKISQHSLGGIERRSMTIETQTSHIYMTIGNSPKTLLWPAK